MDGMSLIIAAAALAVAGFLIYTVIAFGKVKNDLNDKCIEKRSRYEDSMNADGALREQKSVEIIYKETELTETRDRYEKVYAVYAVASQCIALFPLAGILGTVLGLFLSDLTNVDSLVSGLSVALRTTIAGLIASILLKIIEQVSNYQIQRIEAEFEKADTLLSRQLLKKQLLDARNELSRE